MKRVRLISTIAVGGAGLLLALLLLATIGNTDKTAIPSPLIGKPMPHLVLNDLYSKQPFDSETLRGNPFLLNIWGSWCTTCAIEHPILTQLANGHGVTIVGLNYRDTTEGAVAFLQRYGNPYAFVPVDADGTAAIALGVYATPETFVVDANGIIRYKYTGNITEAVVTETLLPLLVTLRHEAS